VKLPTYPSYKRSGITWLPSVPAQWNVSRSDRLVSADRTQVAPEVFVGQDVFHYSIPVVQEKGTGQIENGDSLASAKQKVTKPVVLVSKLNPRKATICIASPQSGFLTICSTEFVALNADQCELRFLEYLTRSELFRQLLDSKVQSVTRSHQRAKPDDIYKFWNAWPSRNEQRAIADFLDRETARLDVLAGKKRELIEKLKEKRTALISRTVTRGLPPEAARAAGLNPHPKLKPSGIEWLGGIPEHWNAKRLKHAAVVTTGFAFSSDDFTADGVPVLRIGDIDQEGQVSLVESKFLPVDYLRRYSNVLVRKGDIVMAMTGATIGKVGRYVENTPALLNQRVCIFRAVETGEQAFLWYLLNSEFYIEHVVLTAFGGAQPNISDTELLSCPVPLPDKPEQRAIANYLDRETAKIDKMMEKVEAAIEKLQEYRTALITAAVTGKIDVRAVDR
jgi:type I restriction enzyme S subunit